MFWITIISLVIVYIKQHACGNIPPPPGPLPQKEPVKVHKCCGRNQIMIDRQCHPVRSANEQWTPVFFEDLGLREVKIAYNLVYGLPDCKNKQAWPVYHYKDSSDKLIMLPDGHLRHYIFKTDGGASLLAQTTETTFFDYQPGQYCLDKVLGNDSHHPNLETQFAIVCLPPVDSIWKDSDVIIKQIVDPALRIIAMVLFALIAVTYFGISQLRDVVGNIIASMAICLLGSYLSDVARIYTENIIDDEFYLTADIFKQIFTLAAFFWSNSLGFYVWKTFRSRNVFLRITDGRKYFYYSCYVWGSTLCMTFMAVFSHFLLDAEVQEANAVHLLNPTQNWSRTILLPPSQCNRVMGWLGISIFSITVGSIQLVNMFFYLTTAQKISRMSVYGRIHHKMRFTFEMYVKIFSIMALWWISMITAWFQYNALCYIYILLSFLQAIIIFYVCVAGCKRVRYLIKVNVFHEKCLFSCCRSSEVESMPSEWGEELSSINMNYY